jgi:SH3-like domain-containing protein
MNLTVHTAHISNYPNPISFKRGDNLTTGRRDEEFHGWIRCRTADGNEGWAPEDFFSASDHNQAVALMDYTATELNTREGESLEAVRELKAWIWCRNCDGQEGWVPKQTLKHD